MKKLLRLAATLMIGFMATTATFAEGDPVKGEKSFRKCKACHGFDPAKRKIGPHLKDIVGRQVAAVEGFKYSKVFQEADFVWDEENLTQYLTAPRKFMKGTKMAFAGIRKPQEIKDLLAYLEQQQ